MSADPMKKTGRIQSFPLLEKAEIVYGDLDEVFAKYGEILGEVEQFSIRISSEENLPGTQLPRQAEYLTQDEKMRLIKLSLEYRLSDDPRHAYLTLELLRPTREEADVIPPDLERFLKKYFASEE